ncbi:MAG: carbohydrate ABC transporter permease [Clostridia bacterium]|nr:carbohydrate ABC transporter permease [Clostridia bacterium]MBR0228298.1 carbohydrate ABC transporter permease [Clostridia bacterium]
MLQKCVSALKKAPSRLLLLAFMASALIPFFYMTATAMTPQAFTLPYPPILFPQRLYLDNFAEAWGSNHFSDYFLNSVLVSLISTVLIILVSSLAGYGFARIAFPGKNILFMILMFSMMVPTLTNLLPQFLLIKGLKLMDKYTGLILTYLGTGIAANTFFLRSSFLSVPHALEESVVIDGGGHWTIWLHIAMPLSAPAVGTFTIMAFSNVWDEFLYALTIIKSPAKRTLPIALRMFQGQNVNNWSLIFAASLIALLPILLVYITMQKQLIRGGITDGMLKE